MGIAGLPSPPRGRSGCLATRESAGWRFPRRPGKSSLARPSSARVLHPTRKGPRRPGSLHRPRPAPPPPAPGSLATAAKAEGRSRPLRTRVYVTSAGDPSATLLLPLLVPGPRHPRRCIQLLAGAGRPGRGWWCRARARSWSPGRGAAWSTPRASGRDPLGHGVGVHGRAGASREAGKLAT